ncbi:MAG: von Willebrand factor type A domain-containing protein [Bacteroidota bacterium]
MKMVKNVVLFMLILVAGTVIAQERIVSGIVTSSDDGKPLSGVNVIVKGQKSGTITDYDGKYKIKAASYDVLVFSLPGFEEKKILVGTKTTINVALAGKAIQVVEEVAVEAEMDMAISPGYPSKKESGRAKMSMGAASYGARPYYHPEPQNWNTEEYATIHDNIFHNPTRNPLSTFSIDVDAASYSNIRRFLNNGQTPPKDAVRIEEMVNYFKYDYDFPEGKAPFSVNTEVSQAPWNKAHRLVHIGLQGKEIPTENLPASNIVFLLDVSGSMNAPNKLPLLKSAFNLLVDQMREQDKVSIVVYAGAAGIVLEPTSGSNKEKIMGALNKLQAGGSTAGGAGIKLAYKLAQENFIEGGNNRIVLATDGDFNIGVSSNAEMERLIEEKRNGGVFLTVLGFGMGNYKDSKMEILADKGNGNYAYIDNILEAKKVLVSEFGGTMFTIAKDVKIQVEFNPALVQAYRLIGYENRKLNDEDFNDDKKDAGELGSGHTVTALYEIIPVGVEANVGNIDPLKYQVNKQPAKGKHSDELMTVKLRYKKPDGYKSELISTTIMDNNKSLERSSDNFRWAAAVAEFGMLLRDSEFKGNSNYLQVMDLAKGAKGNDVNGYRAEFLRMVQSGGLVAKK